LLRQINITFEHLSQRVRQRLRCRAFRDETHRTGFDAITDREVIVSTGNHDDHDVRRHLFQAAEQAQAIAAFQRKIKQAELDSGIVADDRKRFRRTRRLEDHHVLAERSKQHAQPGAKQAVIVDQQYFHVRSRRGR